jgi:RNA polymerase sigma factor (sigma-70 family)
MAPPADNSMPVASAEGNLPVWHASLRGRLYGWAFGVCRRHDDALDVVQEALARLMKCGQRFESTGKGLAWMRRAITTIAIDRWRSQRREQTARLALSAASQRGGGLDVPESEQRRDCVRAALAGLSDAQRMVVLLKVYDGRTFAETAAELGIAEGTAKSHFVRALQTLREELSGSQGTGERP